MAFLRSLLFKTYVLYVVNVFLKKTKVYFIYVHFLLNVLHQDMSTNLEIMYLNFGSTVRTINKVCFLIIKKFH